jgi:hypothetical protein
MRVWSLHLLGLADVERASTRRSDCRDRYSSEGSADRRRSVWLGKGRRLASAAYWPRLIISAGEGAGVAGGSFSCELLAGWGSGRLARNCGNRKGLLGPGCGWAVLVVAMVWVLESVTSRTGAVAGLAVVTAGGPDGCRC